MVIVYTFDSTVNKDEDKNIVLKNYYLESINRVKKLGYTVEMYTNCDWFTTVVDKVHIRKRSSLLWDSYKFIPLLERKDNFILLDGDVFLDDKVNLSSIHDVLFDTYETGNWNLLYARSVNKLTELGIEKVIPEWKAIPQEVMSCGFLYFNDINFRELYADRWIKAEKFITEHKQDLDLYTCTATAAQYLLTILCNHYSKTRHHYSESLGIPNPFYTHHAGKDKYKGHSIRGINKTLL